YGPLHFRTHGAIHHSAFPISGFSSWSALVWCCLFWEAGDRLVVPRGSLRRRVLIRCAARPSMSRLLCPSSQSQLHFCTSRWCLDLRRSCGLKLPSPRSLTSRRLHHG